MSPGSKGTAGTTGTAGTSGAAVTAGAAGTSGAAGTTGGAGAGGQPGSGGGAAGTGGAGGQSGSGGSSASLCANTGLNLPGVLVSEVDGGAPPDVSTYAGGAVTSGRYYLTADTHYGAGTYTGPIGAQYTFDTTAKTIQIGQRFPNAMYFIGFTYTAVSANHLVGTVVCNTSPTNTTTLDLYYTVSGTSITLFQTGSSDVSTI